MELRHLRYFTAVVQWKGYREAWRHLYVAQPSISEAIFDLEGELASNSFHGKAVWPGLLLKARSSMRKRSRRWCRRSDPLRLPSVPPRERSADWGSASLDLLRLLSYPACCANIRLVIREWHCVLKRMCRADRTSRSIGARSTSDLPDRLRPAAVPLTNRA